MAGTLQTEQLKKVDNYEGKDLEAMASATRYSAWITDDIRPYLGSRILEVGAGMGSLSRLLLESEPEFFMALEPARRMFTELESAVRPPDTVDYRLINATLPEAKSQVAVAEIDSIVYVNVLEHIEDDEAEMRTAFDVLKPGGVLTVYVPALPSLYGPFDRRVGHFRRYTKTSLTKVAVNAGFEIVSIRYRDLTGLLPWWLTAKILRADQLNAAAVKLYDRMIPLVRTIDRITGPPIGKNLLLVGVKPARSDDAGAESVR